MTWEADLRYGALLIVGMPSEDEEGLEHMCEWAESHGSVTRVKYLSAMPGTTVYHQGIESGLLRSEIDHLNWLSIEQALVQDELLNYTGLPEQMLRDAYTRVYDSYCPGPVMDFNHYPETLEYHGGNPNDGTEHSIVYAGEDWRKAHSSAAPRLVPGSEKFILAYTGVDGSVAAGAGLDWAETMRAEQFAVRDEEAIELNEGPGNTAK
jgi:hypothetical protein